MTFQLKPLTVLCSLALCCGSALAGQQYPYGDPVRLNMLIRVNRSPAEGGQAITIKDVQERKRVGGKDAELFAYVPADPVPGTQPLYRLRGAVDGKDTLLESLAMRDGGFGDARVLGYPWAKSDTALGAAPLIQATRGGRKVLGIRGEALGSDVKVLGVAAYPRFGRLNESNLALSAGGVTIESNRVAGGALWSWTHQGFEYVNHRDYGREIQSAMSLADASLKMNNPTEAGSVDSDPPRYPFAAYRQGSPCLELANRDVGSQSPTQVSRAIPLDWDPRWQGGGPNMPVIWKDMQLGKDITLNFEGLGPVARYTTVVVMPHSTDKGVVEVPAVYLNGRLSQFFVYDAVADTTTALTNAGSTPHGIFPRSGFGGIIATDESHQHAFGLYAVSLTQGGSVTAAGAGFQYMRWTAPEREITPTSATSTKFNALSRRPIVAGENRYNTYLMSGTLDEVVGYMRKLKALGVK